MWIQSRFAARLTFCLSLCYYLAILLSPLLASVGGYHGFVLFNVEVMLAALGTLAWLIALIHAIFVRWLADHSKVGWPLVLLFVPVAALFYARGQMGGRMTCG